MRITLAFLLSACFLGLASCFKPRSRFGSQQVCTQQTVLRQIFSPRNYCRTLRPDAGGDPVRIYHGFDLLRLASFDLKTEILSIDVWENIEFTDPRLAWNTERCNVGLIRIPRDQVWTPDLEVYDSTAAAPDKVSQPLVTIDGTGKVLYISAKQLTVFCDLPDPVVDGEYNCTFTVGSFAYGCSNLVPEVVAGGNGMNLKYYKGPPQQNGQPWELVSSSSTVYNATFDCCPYPFCVIDYTVTWRFNASLS